MPSGGRKNYKNPAKLRFPTDKVKVSQPIDQGPEIQERRERRLEADLKILRGRKYFDTFSCFLWKHFFLFHEIHDDNVS